MLIVANWKAYVENIGKAKKLVAIAKKLARDSAHSIVLAPPSPFIGALAPTNKSNIAFAAQDVSATSGGAQTGEATAAMYVSTGASYALVGHSERRAMGDTHTTIALKLAHALAHNLIPILCIGEHERDNEGRYLTLIREQITAALEALSPKERAQVIIAYEPLWAIGKSAESAIHPNDLVEMILYIHKVLAELLPGKNSSRALVLYGGAVEPGNIRELGAATRIDGFLIGHASADEATFAELVKHLS